MLNTDKCDVCHCRMGVHDETYQDKTGNVFVCQECFDLSNDGTFFVVKKGG
jgi:ribosomal protein S17